MWILNIKAIRINPRGIRSNLVGAEETDLHGLMKREIWM